MKTKNDEWIHNFIKVICRKFPVSIENHSKKKGAREIKIEYIFGSYEKKN